MERGEGLAVRGRCERGGGTGVAIFGEIYWEKGSPHDADGATPIVRGKDVALRQIVA